MSTIRRFADALERIVWTLVEATGSVGLIAAWQSLPVFNIPDEWVPVVGIVLTVLLAAIKTTIATAVGNKSASLGLPADLEPIPAEAVQHELPAGVGMPLNSNDLDGDGRDDKTQRFVSRG